MAVFSIINLQYMSATYAQVQIQDAQLKISLYLSAMVAKHSGQRSEKALMLATETFFKFMESQQFSKQCYQKLKAPAYKSNFYVLLFLDQMLKNSKYVFKIAKREVQTFFKNVWESTWAEYDNQYKLQMLKLLVRVWGYILGQKCEDNLKRWLEQNYRTKLVLSAERETELVREYGSNEPQKPDKKIEEFMSSLNEQQKPKSKTVKATSEKEKLLFQQLGIDDE